MIKKMYIKLKKKYSVAFGVAVGWVAVQVDKIIIMLDFIIVPSVKKLQKKFYAVFE